MLLIFLWSLFIGLYLINVFTDIKSFSLNSFILYLQTLIALILSFISGDLVFGLLQGVLLCLIIAIIALILKLILKKTAMGDGDYFLFFMFGLLLLPEQIILVILFSSLLGLTLGLIFRKKQLPFLALTFIPFCIIMLISLF